MINIQEKEIIRTDLIEKRSNIFLKIQKGKSTPIDDCMLRQECQGGNEIWQEYRELENTFLFMLVTMKWQLIVFLVSKLKKEGLMYDTKHEKKF